MDKDAILALVLEDEPLIALDVETSFTAGGFSVAIFRSCAEANVWLSGHTPDIAVLDILLTDGSCEAIAAIMINRDVPFLVYSGDRRREHRDSVFSHGTWVTKPCDADALLRAASHLLVLNRSMA